jgi:hypothetical protein
MKPGALVAAFLTGYSLLPCNPADFCQWSGLQLMLLCPGLGLCVQTQGLCAHLSPLLGAEGPCLGFLQFGSGEKELAAASGKSWGLQLPIAINSSLIWAFN